MRCDRDPPPGFVGFDEQAPVHIYRRHLPHWRQEGASYFVTFHLADALPQSRRKELSSMQWEWERMHLPPRAKQLWLEWCRTLFRFTEETIDAGYGACWFGNELYARELERAVLHFHGTRYEVGCFVVMANHCHLVMRPFAGFELEQLTGGIQSTAAKFIVKRENVSAPLWNEECFDRIIRDAEHLDRVVQYIGCNPAKAGVPRPQWRRWMNPDWQSAGWNFADMP